MSLWESQICRIAHSQLIGTGCLRSEIFTELIMQQGLIGLGEVFSLAQLGHKTGTDNTSQKERVIETAEGN